MRRVVGKPLARRLLADLEDGSLDDLDISPETRRGVAAHAQNLREGPAGEQLQRLCKHAASLACRDLAKALPEATGKFWGLVDPRGRGHATRQDFVAGFE